ncbi:hypothetical protein CDD82_5061 [Ophiocordyceps australis]|uniref:UAS domain-containing protein n=1 Tax=Ophiocordyceps australis TaxID=1399860 RepID=A0A2C5ZRT5_9HYPO|nr:hypothetical protein CDD82_5061 [Ophiocordyceps australis]
MADDAPGGAGELSRSQQDALQQYIQVTQQDAADAIALLQRSQWNVQIAIAKFFDGEGPDLVAEATAAQSVPYTSPYHDNLQESLMATADRSWHRPRTEAAPRVVPQQSVTRRPPWLLGLILVPFGWGCRVASSLFRTICYLLSFLPAPLRPRSVVAGPRSPRGRRMLVPRDTAARFKREFDEEYGPNDLSLFEGGLAQAYDLAKKDVKFLLVLLLSPEHDDTPHFVRDTLLAPDVVEFINNPVNNIIIWGGTVLDSEAYQASVEYNCTKFPFTALVCLTPKDGGGTWMAIVKRLAGPMPPATYISELQGAMDRYGGELEVVRAERAAQEMARNIRTEQDSAYERSLAIDRKRTMEKKEAAAAAAEAERRRRQENEALEVLQAKRAQWIAWRANKIIPEPRADDKNVVRVALKMPEAMQTGRIVRRFPPQASVEELYAFVDCYEQLGQSSEAAEAGESKIEKPDDYQHKYKFRIASTLPRRVHEPSTTATLRETIGKSANLIVEEASSEEDEEEASSVGAD